MNFFVNNSINIAEEYVWVGYEWLWTCKKGFEPDYLSGVKISFDTKSDVMVQTNYPLVNDTIWCYYFEYE